MEEGVASSSATNSQGSSPGREQTDGSMSSLHPQGSSLSLKRAASTLKAEALRRYKINHRKSLEQHRSDIEAELAARRKHAPKSPSPGLSTPDIMETPENVVDEDEGEIAVVQEDNRNRRHSPTQTEHEATEHVDEPPDDGRAPDDNKIGTPLSPVAHKPSRITDGSLSSACSNPRSHPTSSPASSSPVANHVSEPVEVFHTHVNAGGIQLLYLSCCLLFCMLHLIIVLRNFILYVIHK